MKAGLTGVIGTYRGLRNGFSFKRMKALLEDAPLKPLHPGIFLRDKAFPASRMSRTEMAGVMGMSLTHLRLVMNGKRPVTPDIAACLGKMFGNGPGAWIAMQAAYDEWVALYETDVSSVPALTAPLLAIANDESQLPSPPRRSLCRWRAPRAAARQAARPDHPPALHPFGASSFSAARMRSLSTSSRRSPG